MKNILIHGNESSSRCVMKKEKTYYFIYLTKNLKNKKGYVGFHSTNTLYDRYRGSGILLHKAFKKYGEIYFVTGILEFCSEKNWEEKETFWIDKFTKVPNGYNLTDGGEGGLGKIISKKSKQQMSKTRRERKLAQGKNNGMYGKHHSEESCKKVSITRILKGLGKGKLNGRFDNTIYKFYNTETGEIFEGYKYDLNCKINSHSCGLDMVIKGYRNHHKHWVLYENK